MARIRTIKPEFFLHEELYDLEVETGLPIRVAFAGLWCQADRKGRFKWKPRTLKAGVLPFDDIDFSRVLDALTTRGFVVKYACGTRVYGCIPSFENHQIINNRESKSELPSPDGENSQIVSGYELGRVDDASGTRQARVVDFVQGKGKEGKGRERKGREGDICPESENPTSGLEPSSHQFDVDGGEGTWALPQIKLDEYVAAFPNLDVERQMELAAGWIRNNPTKRKTARGMPRFLFSWLSRAQETPRRGAAKTSLMENPEIQAWLNQ